MDPDFEANRHGELTKTQRLFLATQLLQRLGFILVWLLLILIIYQRETRTAIGEVPLLSMAVTVILGGGALLLLCVYLWMYGLDLWITNPVKGVGVLHKYQKRALRSDQYWLVVDQHHILTTKASWSSLRSGSSYEFFYARWTKWLLSFRQVSA
jgi:hypothetical protein